MTTMYGIPNCDTIRKARRWLADAGVDYDFHDYKKSGAPAARLKSWAAEAGWEALLNKAGTTFRKLPPEQKSDLDEAKALALMVEHPSMIKRPVLEADGELLIGFDPERYQQVLKG